MGIRMPHAERRRQLVEAAIRVMTRDGVARTTTRAVVAEAGVSLSVFHYCFTSKQELLEAVMEAISEHSESRVLATLSRQMVLQETVRGTIRAGLQAYWDHVLAHRGEHLLTYELTQYALREPGYEHLAQRQYERYVEAHAKVIRRLGALLPGAELVAPATTAARYLAALTDGLTLNFLVLGDEEKAGEVLDTVADQILALLAPAEG
ncbi:TetR family transcriptional regulator [Streptomyces sp. A7024]|uniref:TetR family transcriptional regulator n=1 Tax=Streptomyces coryli TaxID=1128680 RepID=A0A6G4UCA5_9ACTN|nr:TetR family transcriptional regulator [Streptomyces coryli]NGN69865.1 TetR family transcriptional regulator [Streptomyces coryli]